MQITEVVKPAKEDFEALKNGLNRYNEKHGASAKVLVVASSAKDENDEILGGILGELHWGWLYVKGLWVAEPARGKGIGALLLTKLEDYAASNGTTNFRLETTSFQALGFYEKQGYTVFGELPDIPPAHTSYFLKKQVHP